MIDQFTVFAKAIQRRFDDLSKGELFVVDAGDLYAEYLAAFPEGTNPIYKTRTEHDCSCCKQFILNLGSVVSIDFDQSTPVVKSVWGCHARLPYPYRAVAARLDKIVLQAAVKTVFRTSERQFGNETTRQLLPDNSVRTWIHFSGRVATKHRSATPDTARSEIEATAHVFRRGLEELTPDSFTTVLDLIAENALYRGAEFKPQIERFRDLQRQYQALNDPLSRDVFVWYHAAHGPAVRFRNTAIGTLLVDLSAGEDVESAVRSFEAKVAPQNYKRTTALITPKMINDALVKVRTLGLEPALERRHAQLRDISVNNVLWVDNSARTQMKDNLASLLLSATKTQPLRVGDATPITTIEDFVTQLPNASSVELKLDNRHLGNFVSLTAPVHTDAGRLFKWDNGFAWSYDGDAADSIKQRVKRAGGNVNATMRVSLAWFNTDDLDIHVIEPDGNEVYFGNRCGKLDVDMNAGGPKVRDPVENVCWKGRVPDGKYTVGVHNFCRRETIDVGFELEVEFQGVIRRFSYLEAVQNRVLVRALILHVRDGKLAEIQTGTGIKEGGAQTEKWGVKTDILLPVDVVLSSPNHWDGQALGAKHWFFVLRDCKNPDPVRGLYNEYLRSDLEPHRKVFEVLGSKLKAPYAEEQMSGVGFTAARGASVTAIVRGEKLSRAFNIQF